jgi:hypothetical protein
MQRGVRKHAKNIDFDLDIAGLADQVIGSAERVNLVPDFPVGTLVTLAVQQ